MQVLFINILQRIKNFTQIINSLLYFNKYTCDFSCVTVAFIAQKTFLYMHGFGNTPNALILIYGLGCPFLKNGFRIQS